MATTTSNQPATSSSYSATSAPSSNDARGLHTLVDGLTLSPTSPVAAAPSHRSQPSTGPPQINPQASSIFNNPTIASSSSPTTPAHHSQSRLHSSMTRKLGSKSCAAVVNSNDSAVKEVDDPTTPSSTSSHLDKNHAPTTLSRLFATPTPQNTYSQGGRCNSYRGSDAVKLEEFLYTRGFCEGACSDITIIAFGSRYPLHRLILDRSPFFSSCFNGGPWLESKSSEISLSPDVSDPNITQHAFEIALARLYGHVDRAEEDKHALPLLAAASYLDLQDLAESCVSSLLRNLKTGDISTIVRFVTNSYYGHLTERLLESAKALLYRDGWEMAFEEWDGISGEVAADIVGYEGFYVPTEYTRYIFVKQLIDWRIKNTYSIPQDQYVKVSRSHSLSSGTTKVDDDSEFGSDVAVDEDLDIKPLRDLLEDGIYYMHMSFEELQKITEDRDALGRSTVSENTIREALWQQMLLRQRIVNVPMSDPELGIAPKFTRPLSSGQNNPAIERSSGRSPFKKIQGEMEEEFFTVEIGQGKKKRYSVPTVDSTAVIGDCPEQPSQGATNQRGIRGPSVANESSADVHVSDAKDVDSPPPEEFRYSEFPPFRFSAEFRNVRGLKEKKRVYSKTVFYAGSYWNIYIQKVKSSKNIQLGVYLHRAKDRDGSGSGGSSNRDGETVLGQLITVDDRGRYTTSEATNVDDHADITMTTDNDTTSTAGYHRPGANTSVSRSLPGGNVPSPHDLSTPAVPPYVDSRPMIKTYFKIFSPSRKGKMLSMFSSHADSFNFSQSWGWKSSSLILEEGLIGDSEKESRLRFMVVLGNV